MLSRAEERLLERAADADVAEARSEDPTLADRTEWGACHDCGEILLYGSGTDESPMTLGFDYTRCTSEPVVFCTRCGEQRVAEAAGDTDAALAALIDELICEERTVP